MTSTSVISVETDVPATMRDGTVLRADIYRPDGPGPFPVLVTRTPYGKAELPASVDSARGLAARGYIVVAQDVRGRFASGGEFQPYRDDIADGYDTITWAAALPGSTGAAGMFGVSYMGTTQWLAAASLPLALRAICPVQAGPGMYEGRKYYGGAFQFSDWLSWALRQAVDTADKRGLAAPELRRFAALSREAATALQGGDTATAARARIEADGLLQPWLRHLPLTALPVLAGLAPHYLEWMAHPTYDEYWRGVEALHRLQRMDVPCLSVGGWYDVRLKGNLDAYTGLRTRARTPQTRRAQRLLVGPWAHGQFLAGAGAIDFGPDAALELVPLYARWFDQWLRGIDTGLLDEPPVFVMGANHWRDEDDWPLPRTRYEPWYFHSAGGANALTGDGTLDPRPPSDEPHDSYVYDPADPAPSIGGKVLGAGIVGGAFDQRPVEERPDVLCYTSAPIERDLEVTGPLIVALYAASSAPDTDWTAKLVDVHPDGFAQNLQEGIIRAGHRVPGAPPSPIRPGEVYEYTIDLWATSNVFLAGHRLRVEISSANFPHWDRNTNTGLPFAEADHMASARQTVFHDAGRPSHILLPVTPAP